MNLKKIAFSSLSVLLFASAAQSQIFITESDIEKAPLCQRDIFSAEDIRTMLTENIKEVEHAFELAGYKKIFDSFKDRLQEVEIIESPLKPEDELKWMIFKKGDNDIYVEKNIALKDEKILNGYEFFVDIDKKRYIFWVPVSGGNISLKEVVHVIYITKEVVREVPGPERISVVERPVLVVKSDKGFPWPPPTPSASVKIPSKFLKQNSNTSTLLKDVAEKLEASFDEAGYSERSYYPIHEVDGFALISRLERFNPDGTPSDPRWRTDGTVPSIKDFTSYINALFTANPGYYRVIAFVVTSKIYKRGGEATKEQAEDWLKNGESALSPEIGKKLYTDNHYCKALIYEFEKPSQEKAPFFRDDDETNLSGKDHLEKSNLWSALEK